jgi:hypothetical protein
MIGWRDEGERPRRESVAGVLKAVVVISASFDQRFRPGARLIHRRGCYHILVVADVRDFATTRSD